MCSINQVASLCIVLGSVCGAGAQPVVIPSPEPGTNGNFGIDVDLKDGVLLVGAPEGADGDEQGDAYLFDADTGALLFELFPDPAAIDSKVFGFSVSLGGGIAAVAGPADDVGSFDRVWLYDVATGARLFELLPPPELGIIDFGLTLSMSDAGAGPTGEDPIVAAMGGRVLVNPGFRVQRFVFLYNARTGAFIESVLPGDDSTGGTFGQELDIYHDGAKGRLVAAANSSTIFAQPGATAYLFDVTDPASPAQIGTLIGSDTVDADEFATAVAVDGDTAAVNAPLRVGSSGEIGAIYLFNADTATEIGRLARPASTPALLAAIAPSIDIESGNVMYGTGDTVGVGRTYIQSVDGSVVAELGSPDQATQGAFGFGVAIDINGSVIDAAVGDPIAAVIDGVANAGEAYVFADVSGVGGGCPADFAEPFGTLNFFDLSAFITAFNTMDPSADLAAPFGAFNFFDVVEYIALFNAGCP